MIRFLAVIFCLFCLVYTSKSVHADVLPQSLYAKVLEVKDGDTVRVQIPVWIDQNITTTIRIRLIDTPELRSRCAMEKEKALQAKSRLNDLVMGRTVLLKNIEHGKYAGRVLADLYLEDTINIADLLIHENYARAYDGGTRTGWC